MFVFLSNGEILEGKQPSLCGKQVIGIFLTKDDNIDELVPYFKNVVNTRMIDIDQKALKIFFSDALHKYHSQHQLKNEQV